MHARFVLIAAFAAMSGQAFAAEPAKPAPQTPAHAQPRDLVLASAEQVQTPARADQQAVQAKPHRIARVTTCRCGDQQAQPDDQQ